MRRRRRVAFALTVALAAGVCAGEEGKAPTTSAATTTAPAKPPTIAELKKIERAEVDKRLGDVPAIGATQVSQVIRVRIENGRVVVSSPLESFDGERLVRFGHPDDLATIDFHPMTAGTGPDQPRFIQMYRYDFRDPKCVFFHTSVLAHPGYAQIAGSWQYLEGMRDVSIVDTEEKLDESGGKTDAAITMRVHAIDDGGNETHKVEYTAPDLRTMLREHPAEVNEYLRPVLRNLGAESLLDMDPTLAWQVFAAEARPDPKAAEQVKALLPRLDAADFADREQAAEDLKKLGPAAAVAMLQLDRTKLSAEQNSRLDEVLAPYQQLDRLEAERMGEDPAFLLSAMDSQDAELRRVAAARLARRLGGAVAFEVGAAPDVRHEQVEALRRKLLPPAATQAVERPE